MMSECSIWKRVELGELFRFVPDADRQRLGRRGRPGPGENSLEQGQRFRAVVRIPGLVVEVPGQDAPVAAQEADDPAGVILEDAPAVGALEEVRPGTLDPARVMDARPRRRLRAERELGIPAIVEEDEHRPDVVPVGDLQEPLQSPQEAAGVLLPQEIVKEDAHGVEPEVLGPAELLVDDGRVEGRRLPHLERVDGRPGDVVAAERPGLAVGPRPGPFRPSSGPAPFSNPGRPPPRPRRRRLRRARQIGDTIPFSGFFAGSCP